MSSRPMPNEQWWYINSSEEVVGPLPVPELKMLLIDQILSADSLICREGDDAWIPLGDLFEGPTQTLFFTHFDDIDGIIEGQDKGDADNALLAAASDSSGVGMGFAAGPLHNDTFGNIYSGDSRHSVGRLEHGAHPGTLHTDAFGNVFSGDSHLSVGHTDKAPLHEGTLHTDNFGNVYAGDSHFSIGHLDPNGHH